MNKLMNQIKDICDPSLNGAIEGFKQLANYTKNKTMETKHTPTHWNRIGSGYIIGDNKNNRVVTIDAFSKNADANAKLIAAAPELLEALKLVQHDVRDWCAYNFDQVDSFDGNEREMQYDVANEINKRLIQLTAAINKATL